MTSTPRRRHHASSPFQPGPEVVDEVFEPGARVSHDAYGLGRVVSVQGDKSAQVDFGDQVRHVPLPCKALTNL